MPLECLVSDANEECELYGDEPEPYITREPGQELLSRLPWLMGLMAFLTVSSAILELYDGVLQRHLAIAFYLTPLVGCGGNSGSQAAAMVLQALATGELKPTVGDVLRVAEKELLVGLGAGLALSAGVAARMALFGSPPEDAVLIAIAMAVTVLFSVMFGALTPLMLKRIGLDPAKVSGPLLSTTVDIFGVLAACVSAQLLEAAGYLH
jgi:magnesium transporter